MRFRFLITFLMLAGTGYSQSFVGYIDGYYNYNFQKPDSRFTSYRLFDTNHNTFSLNYAEVAIEKSAAPVGFRIDVGAGDAARIIHASEPGGSDLWQHIEQVYVSAKKSKVTVDFGKFVTPMGAEVIETKDNWNYSRSFLFGLAIPFYHFGLRASVKPAEHITLTGFVVNGWDNVVDNNASKTVGVQTQEKYEKLTFTQNYFVGREQTALTVGSTRLGKGVRQLVDATLQYDLSPKVSVMANYDYGMDREFFSGDRLRWQGFAVYGRVSPTPKLKVSPRFEWFDDPQGSRTGIAWQDPQKTALREGTLTSQFAVQDDMSLWAEYRYDWANQNAFEGRNDSQGSTLRNHQHTVTFGVTFVFSHGTP